MTELLQQHFAAIETWRVKLEGEMALLRWIVRVAVLEHQFGIIIRLFVPIPLTSWANVPSLFLHLGR